MVTANKKIWILIIVFAALVIYGIYNIFKPDRFPISFIRGEVRELTPYILVGPYPSEAELFKLKRMGVDKLISLMELQSAIEGRIVYEEKKISEKFGFKYLNYPMNFTSLEGEENIKQISNLINYLLSAREEKIYIHCYLGRHRIRILEREFLKASR